MRGVHVHAKEFRGFRAEARLYRLRLVLSRYSWPGCVVKGEHPYTALRLQLPSLLQATTMPHNVPGPVKAIISNPVSTRNDLIDLLQALLNPLLSSLSSGGARVRIGHSGTHFDAVAAEFEGYARSLWGLAPIFAAEPDNVQLKEFRDGWVKGLENGTDPEHEEYWGDHIDKDQRFVEMAAVVSDVSWADDTVAEGCC